MNAIDKTFEEVAMLCDVLANELVDTRLKLAVAQSALVESEERAEFFRQCAMINSETIIGMTAAKNGRAH
jgi:hypothetical protein